jgi:NAD(P)-dependent dehydrogenase (short-subunit alcohol dehydrogenase family)
MTTARTPEVFVCRTALVTGGASGIGRAVVEALCERGIRVFVADIDLARATDVVADIAQRGRNAEAFPLDVSKSEDVAALFRVLRARCQGLDLLVNGAAVLGDSVLIEEMSDAQWRRVMSVNLDGTFFCCREAVRWMKETGGGRIVNFSSVAGLMPTPGALHYSASKGAVIQLTKTLARETARYNLRVNAVAPGYVQTPMLDAMDPSFREQTLHRTPLKRFATPEEIAGLVAFLAGPDADFFTGQVLSPNGGLVI